ncbi:hypothetical protein MAR621_03161 [Maribacter dokdonensis]|uniref:hypothetical protein n=1 Tax=Maribacter dokdonensis TaxID=320912 RepID=UPI001B0E2218|nr:hypothetical protein [Maribacter dokdonensis]CAG2532967.1 hypothetical protein MAR621_03161 [Maribacter dokdonensis]
MKAEFTDIEKETLKGKVRGVARKHGVSHTYVNQIISGDADIKSQLSSNIYDSLQQVITLFTPKKAI